MCARALCARCCLMRTPECWRSEDRREVEPRVQPGQAFEDPAATLLGDLLRSPIEGTADAGLLDECPPGEHPRLARERYPIREMGLNEMAVDVRKGGKLGVGARVGAVVGCRGQAIPEHDVEARDHDRERAGDRQDHGEKEPLPQPARPLHSME